MKKLYLDRDDFIAYYCNKINKKNAPYVIFVHGFMSNMNGAKAMHIEGYCRKKGYNFIRFDQFGSGSSSGEFLNQTITTQLAGLEAIITKIAMAPVVLVGSSMGGWLTLLASVKLPELVKAIVCLAPAPDFTENLVWNKLSDTQKELMQKQGYLNIPGKECDESTPVAYNFILDARNHLLLDKKIEINGPVHLIHGIEDKEVPYQVSAELLEKIISDRIVLKLIKDATHRLSQPEDLKILENSLEELLPIATGKDETL